MLTNHLLKQLFFLSSVLFIFACNSPHKQLTIHFKNSAGIRSNSEVICNGRVIGHVTDLNSVSYPEPSVNICIDLDISGLPQGSKFIIREKDLLTTAIYVVKGKSGKYLSRSSKIKGAIKTQNYVRIRHL